MISQSSFLFLFFFAGILDKDIAFVPINIRKMHWILAAIQAGQKRIQIYDSLGGRYPNLMVNLKKYLKLEYLDKKKTAMPNQRAVLAVDWMPFHSR